ncbi:MAG: hypothetical protein DBX47_06545 [Clostridiales bacterium]|nr:MAG: hypothetical protein DBX47_06545 [Clostridiales bacterium]
MLTVFNRRELLCTYDMKAQADIRGILANNNIEYKVKTVNQKSSSVFDVALRGTGGSLGENMDFEYEYIIYVHKKDYDKAAYLTGCQNIF